jgi:hypothetical protein
MLSLPFAAKYIIPNEGGFPFQVTAPLGVVVISVAGLVVLVYAHFGLSDIKDHMERNWRRSGAIGDAHQYRGGLSGRKRSGWVVLRYCGWAALVGFVFLLAIAVISLGAPPEKQL